LLHKGIAGAHGTGWAMVAPGRAARSTSLSSRRAAERLQGYRVGEIAWAGSSIATNLNGDFAYAVEHSGRFDRVGNAL